MKKEDVHTIHYGRWNSQVSCSILACRDTHGALKVRQGLPYIIIDLPMPSLFGGKDNPIGKLSLT